MKRAAKIWRAVLSLAVVILIFGIWRLPVGEERYSVIGAWIQVFRAESCMDFGRTYTGALSYYGNSGGGTLSASADSDGIWKKDSHIGSGLQGDGVS